MIVYLYPLDLHRLYRAYEDGVALQVSPLTDIGEECFPKTIKSRSRMQYWLADRLVDRKDAGCLALMLSGDGLVRDATAASIAAYWPERGLVVPPKAAVLPSISLQVTTELCQAMGVPVVRQEQTLDELVKAPEIIYASATVGVTHVSSINGQPCGAGRAGFFIRELRAKWIEHFEHDFVTSAHKAVAASEATANWQD